MCLIKCRVSWSQFVWQNKTSFVNASFIQVFDKVLGELEPVYLAEQDFCCKFFLYSGVWQSVE